MGWKGALAVVVASVALVGCEFSVFEPPAVAATVDAEGLVSVPSPRVSFETRQNEVTWIRVNVGRAPAAARPLLMAFETNSSSVALEVYSMFGTLIAKSERRGEFSRDSWLFNASDVRSESISVTWNCVGPCVLDGFRSGSYFVKVIPTQGTRVSLFAFAVAESDVNEPNDSGDAARSLMVTADGVSVSGSLERVGDADFFRVNCVLGLDGVRLAVMTDFAGDVRLLGLGVNVRKNTWSQVVACGELVYVASAVGDAGADAVSRYSLVASPVRY